MTVLLPFKLYAFSCRFVKACMALKWPASNKGSNVSLSNQMLLHSCSHLFTEEISTND